MEKRPVIGFITLLQETQSEPDPHAPAMHKAYVRAVVEAGAEALLIPLIHHDQARLRSFYDRINGLFLTGGADVDPTHYGEVKHALCEAPDPVRDQTELTLFRWARADRKPVLGICRGCQLINAAMGGNLHQDLAAQLPESIRHNYFSTLGHPRDLLTHEVKIEPKSHLGKILGETNVPVNSMHHQGVRDLAPGLVPTAHAPDGVVEGFEASDKDFLIGVQWHPEELIDQSPAMRRLFSAFVQAAGAHVSHARSGSD